MAEAWLKMLAWEMAHAWPCCGHACGDVEDHMPITQTT